ncbi:CaiB/BaiF CoA transferase family protein [Rhodovibrionaceae bacterium A322]
MTLTLQDTNSRTGGDDLGWQPLKGLKVIDFSMLLPGPITTLILADLGAEVIKVEPPGGDYSRHMKGEMYACANRNKTSIVLDLKAEGSDDIIKRLAEYGDVAIEGFRPGVADRLGFGPAQLHASNPGLIYCSISGFGQTGPDAKKAGHDLAYIAMGGGLANKGQLRQPPSRATLPVADIAGGAYAAVAILAALQERDAGKTGAVLDLSLYEAVLYSSAIRFGFTTDPESVDHLYPANDLFTCADGRQLALTVIEVKFWDNFVRATQDLDPRFGDDDYATEDNRKLNYERLMGLLDELFARRPAQEWVDYFDQHDVPTTICVTAQETVKSAHAQARALHVETDHGTVMPFPVIASGQRLPKAQRPAPEMGADGTAILTKLGFSEADIAGYAEDKVVLLPSEG